MREVVVYFIRDEANDRAYLCQGVLMDDLKRAGYTVSRSCRGSIQQTIVAPGGYHVVLRREILTCSEEEYSKMLRSNETCIYKDSEGSPSWGIYKVPNVEYVWGIDRRRNDVGVPHELRNSQYVAEVRKLNTRVYEPAVFPMKVMMHRDNKGRLYCRMKAHPETEGVSDIGKLYFPDRTWEHPMEGEALVSIVEDGDSYGFVKGTMVGYELPDLSVALPWLKANLKPTTQLYLVKGSRHGSYIGYYDAVVSEYFRLDVKNGVMQPQVYFPILEDINDGVFELKTVEQLLQENTKPVIQEPTIDLSRVLSKFVSPEFSPVDGKENRQLEVIWTPHGRWHGENETIYRAIREEILTVYSPEGYHFTYLYVNDTMTDKQKRSWVRDIEELMDAVNAHNAASSKRIIELLQQGKLRLKMS